MERRYRRVQRLHESPDVASSTAHLPMEAMSNPGLQVEYRNSTLTPKDATPRFHEQACLAESARSRGLKHSLKGDHMCIACPKRRSRVRARPGAPCSLLVVLKRHGIQRDFVYRQGWGVRMLRPEVNGEDERLPRTSCTTASSQARLRISDKLAKFCPLCLR